MKNFKKIVLGAAVAAFSLASAQTVEKPSMKNMFKLGINAGYSLPDDTHGFALGADLSYQNLVTPGFGLGIATGYTHYFGSDNTVNGYTFNNNDHGLVPVAALLRYYPQNTGFYLGADLGYGFITGEDRVASNYTVNRPDGGFYLKPEVGYHNDDWNFALQYQKVFTGDEGNIGDQKFSMGALGLALSYNIPLGK